MNKVSSCRMMGLTGVLILATALTFCVAGWSDAASPADTKAAKIDYPTKPVNLYVPMAAGGVTDTFCRALSEAMKRTGFPKPVVLVNKPGAGGITGTAEFVRQKPDGYNISPGSYGWMALAIHMNKPAPYSIDDVTAIIQFCATPITLVVKADAPWKNIKDLVDYAKANPGKVRLSHSGNGTYTHIIPVEFADKVGAKFTYIPLAGTAPTITSVLGDNSEVGSVYPSDAVPQVKSKEMRVLAIMSESRLQALPDCPTLKEQGIDMVRACGFPVVAPKGTRPEIIKFLHDSIKKAIEDPTFVKQMTDLGFDLRYYNTQDADRMLRDWYKAAGELVVKAGIAPK
jgi:tripartite-type tricarboxylate transporter receptor subunit TctC